MSRALRGIAGTLLLLLGGCASTGKAPLPAVAPFELERFMGDWYVIASIATWFERDGFAAVETYRLREGVSPPQVDVLFRFRRGSFDAPVRTLTSTGFVDPQNPAEWKIQFFWPVRLDYRVIHVDPGYRFTVIARRARDYVWVMARTPQIEPEDYEDLVEVIREAGYDPSELRRIPQRPAG